MKKSDFQIVTITYYLILPDYSEPIPIGVDNGYGKFWTDLGFEILDNLINNKPELLDGIKIVNHLQKEISITMFLDKIARLKLMIN